MHGLSLHDHWKSVACGTNKVTCINSRPRITMSNCKIVLTHYNAGFYIENAHILTRLMWTFRPNVLGACDKVVVTTANSNSSVQPFRNYYFCGPHPAPPVAHLNGYMERRAWSHTKHECLPVAIYINVLCVLVAKQ